MLTIAALLPFVLMAALLGLEWHVGGHRWWRGYGMPVDLQREHGPT